MLGAVIVFLQRDLCARVHRDPLDLEPVAAVDAVVGAPGTMHLAMQVCLLAVIGDQPFDDGLDGLGLGPVRHQHGVRRLDDYQVFHACGGDEPVGAADVTVPGIQGDDVAQGGVSVGVPVGQFPEGGPGAHVAPATVQGNHGSMPGLLHDRVVDGVRRACGEGIGIEPYEIGIPDGIGDGRCRALRNLGLVVFEFLEEGSGAEQEHAAVPGEFPAFQVSCGGLGIWFFHELRDLPDALGNRHGTVGPDVTVAGLGAVRDDAEGNQVSRQSGLPACPDGCLECRGVRDGMIRRQYQHQQIIGIPRIHQPFCRRRNGRCGIPAAGFEQYLAVGDPAPAHLFGDEEAVVAVGDDEGRACMVQAGAPGKGFAKQRVFVENGQELLGEAAPGQRPEPGTGATGKDHGYEHERRITFVLRGAYWTIDAPRETTGAEVFMVHRPRRHDRASGSRQIALPRIHALFD